MVARNQELIDHQLVGRQVKFAVRRQSKRVNNRRQAKSPRQIAQRRRHGTGGRSGRDDWIDYDGGLVGRSGSWTSFNFCLISKMDGRYTRRFICLHAFLGRD
jgi:hypothetical protein